MKCIRMKDTREIKRVPNDVAHLAVNTGAATYCSKKEWKEEVRDLHKKEVEVH